MGGHFHEPDSVMKKILGSFLVVFSLSLLGSQFGSCTWNLGGKPNANYSIWLERSTMASAHND